MQRCPSCGSCRAWQVGDGRFKCCDCRRKYSWRSVWASTRLNSRVRHRLLDYFVMGVPVYRQRFEGRASAPAAERFYRLVRGVMAFQEGISAAMDTSGDAGPETPAMLVFGVREQGGMVSPVIPEAGQMAQVATRIRAEQRENVLCYEEADLAWVSLRLHRDRVVFRAAKGVPRGRSRLGEADAFWRFAQEWISRQHSVHLGVFHLYLGEVFYRYNRRNRPLKPLILEDMKSTSRREIEPLLVRKR